MTTMSESVAHPPTELDAGEVVLRVMTTNDWVLEQGLSHDPDVVRWTFYPEAMDRAAAVERVTFSVRQARAAHFQRYVIWHGDMAVGTCGVAHLDTPTPEIMYVLLPTARGNGWATMAAKALANWTMDAGYSAVRLETVEGNTASEHVAQRAGFRQVSSTADDHRGSPATIHLWQRDHPTATASRQPR